MGNDVRVAVVGYGLAGRVFHARLIGAVPGLAVSHVVTGDPGRRAQAESELPGVTVVSSVDELWQRADDFEAVVVATANAVHVPVATAAVELGKPTVVDKPLAVTATDARYLVELARRRAVPLTVFHNRRWDSDTLTVRRLLGEGVLGQVIRFESRFQRFRPQVSDGWRETASADEGGGLLLDLGSHLVDQALHLFGPVGSVYAEVDVRRAGGTADDDCFLALEHRSGVRSHLWASALSAVTGPRIRVHGSAGGYVQAPLDGQEDALRAGTDPAAPGWGREPAATLCDGAGERRVTPERGAWPAYYVAFRDAVRRGTPVPVNPGDAVRGLEILAAARTSAAERRTVQLPADPGVTLRP